MLPFYKKWLNYRSWRRNGHFLQKKYLLFVSVVFFCFTSGLIAKATPVLQISSSPTHSPSVALTFDVATEANLHVFPLNQPWRLVVDIPHGRDNVVMTPAQWQGTCIQDVRQSYHSQGDYRRLVFDLCQPVHFSTEKKVLNAATNRWRVWLTAQAGTMPDKKKLPIMTLKAPQPAITLPHTKQQRKVVVVIDAGHGGKDPGAIGRRGVQEKTVVMAIAQELYRLVQKEPGMTAVMTRNGDYYLTLRERLQKARSNKADVFIAIHADIFKYARSHGSSVYALSLKGATSEAARWLAAKDNYSELGGVDLHGKDDILRSVLIDLSQKATITSSLHLGSAVLHQMGLLSALHSTRVEQARFVVLKSPDIPSILVETGFLSNPTEVKKLTSKRYQQQIAQSIMDGLRTYFYDSPPTGTWIAAHVPSKEASTY